MKVMMLMMMIMKADGHERPACLCHARDHAQAPSGPERRQSLHNQGPRHVLIAIVKPMC